MARLPVADRWQTYTQHSSQQPSTPRVPAKERMVCQPSQLPHEMCIQARKHQQTALRGVPTSTGSQQCLSCFMYQQLAMAQRLMCTPGRVQNEERHTQPPVVASSHSTPSLTTRPAVQVCTPLLLIVQHARLETPGAFRPRNDTTTTTQHLAAAHAPSHPHHVAGSITGRQASRWDDAGCFHHSRASTPWLKLMGFTRTWQHSHGAGTICAGK